MAKVYSGRFKAPKDGSKGYGWLALAIFMVVFTAEIEGVLKLLGIAGCIGALKKRSECQQRLALNQKFESYCAVIGSRESIPVRELARVGSESMSSVRKNLQVMISKNYFGSNAYLDVEKDCLIAPLEKTVSDKAAESVQNWANIVMDLIRSLRGDDMESKEERVETGFVSDEEIRRRAEAQETTCQEAAEGSKADRSKKCGSEKKSNYMDELENTLNELYRLNTQIADEGVSRRIDRIGELTAGIFRAVIQNPEREGDVRKFMNYYLPSTLKLLKSYDMLEDQSFQGDNIQASRKKIESVLDTLIEAFEKQLDRLFKNDALDIATDIDVLETMMAGDGLSSRGQIPFARKE